MVELGRRELGVDEIPGVDVRIGDARTLLAALPAASADVVVGDAFGARSVPWHLATAEFVADVHRVLRHDGVYVLNVIDHDPWQLLAAEVATLAAPVPARRAPGPARAARAGRRRERRARRLRPPDRRRRARGAGRGPRRARSVLDDAARPARFAGDAPVLTDDWAPVDQLMS